MHLRKSNEKGKTGFHDREFEEGSSTDDLQRGQHYLLHIYMRNKHIARYLTNVLEEGEVEVFILQPGEFQVAIDVGAIDESISEIPVVMVPVGGDRHPACSPDAYSFLDDS